MNELSSNPSLKEINAYKKKLCWGDVPTIYNMAAISVSDLDGILIHGFDSAYKTILDKTNWNLDYLQGSVDDLGEITVKRKPKISLRHVYDEQNYELHCYPVVQGERINRTLINHEFSSFKEWSPETMRMLFRVSSIVAFIVYAFRNGDKADMALLRYTHQRIEQLISHLRESFEIIDVIGYSVADFCRAINDSKNALEINQLLDTPNEELES